MVADLLGRLHGRRHLLTGNNDPAATTELEGWESVQPYTEITADSVSLVLDDGSAFTGDLTPPALIGEDDAGVTAASWRLLRELGATRIYPGHGPIGRKPGRRDDGGRQDG